MENVLQEINRRYISLKDEEVRRNNQILESVLSLFIERMKSIDPLFKAMYRRVFYGGSYYDGLRVGKPEEFDLDLLLDIPRYAEPVLIESNIPGFVHLQLKKFDAWMKQPEAQPAYKNFRKLFDEKFFLSTVKTLEWMESIVQRSLNGFSMNGFEIKFRKGGPALTLHVFGPGMKMDVDLVTCFVFSGNKWPVHGFRSNPFPSTKPEFFIVPKKPKAPENQPIPRYWRLSFQEQERVLIDNKGTVKPTIKLLKKLRDSLQHTSIASYYIKTVLLHLIDQKEISFWRQPLSQVFMTVLKEYCDFIKSGRIPYYWNKKNNLIGKVNGNTLQNINGRLTAVIKDIENNPDKPDTVAKYLLTTDELRDFTTRAGTPVIFQQVSPSPQEQQSSCIIV